MYYRLYDSQCDRYMASGYNAKGKKQLTDDYASYKDGADELTENWNELTLSQRMQEIEDDEFTIESSLTKFKEQELC